MRQWLKKKSVRVGLLLLVIVTVVNLVVLFLPHTASYINVSGSDTYLLSDTAKRYLSGVDSPVEILYYSKGGKANADRDLYSFVLRCAEQNPQIRVTLVDTSPEETSATDQSITVRAGSRSRTLRPSDLYLYYNTYFGLPMTLQEYANVMQATSEQMTAETYTALMTYYGRAAMQSYFSGEANLTGAIRYVLSESAPVVGIYSTEKMIFNAFLRQELEQACYDVRTLTTLQGFTGDFLLLNLAADLSAEDASALDSYLAAGGKVLLATSYLAYNAPNLAAVTAKYGLSAPNELNVIYDVSSSNPSSVYYANATSHPLTDVLGGSFVGYEAHSINLAETEGVQHSVLLRSGEASVLKMNKDASELPTGSFNLCVLAEKGDSALLWLSMSPDSLSNEYSGGVNYALIKSAAGWFTGHTETKLNLSNKAIPSTYLAVTSGGLVFWTIAFAVLLPIGILTAGGIRYYLRKKR